MSFRRRQIPEFVPLPPADTTYRDHVEYMEREIMKAMSGPPHPRLTKVTLTTIDGKSVTRYFQDGQCVDPTPKTLPIPTYGIPPFQIFAPAVMAWRTITF